MKYTLSRTLSRISHLKRDLCFVQVSRHKFYQREVEVLYTLRSDSFVPGFYGIIVEDGVISIFMEIIGRCHNLFVINCWYMLDS